MDDSSRSVTGLVGRISAAWWAYGLALRERRPAGAEPTAIQPDPRRLDRWRAGYEPDGAGRFTRRLADIGLDEQALSELLGEPAEALAGRRTRPDWVETIERAIAIAPEGASAATATATTAADPIDQLASVLRPLVEVALDELDVDAARSQLDRPSVATGFADQLGRALGQLAVRTLVLELNVARVDGRLVGETGRDRFASFVRTEGTSAGLASLFAEYPVLARILGTACRHAVAAHREILTRFADDRAVIVTELLDGVDPGPLVAIETGSGDSHRGGRSVALLRFADGRRVVYKPRSLALQLHFHELIGWLNRAVPWLNLRTVGSLLREGYGWQEFIVGSACADLAGVESFYLRQGALLALLNALDGTDIHHENVIACADQPILVDIETLFHPTLLPATLTGPDPALRALMSSVHRTSLLPTLMVGEHGALDISGVGGDRDRVYPLDMVSWADAGTDRMRLVRGAAEFVGSANRPRVGDVDAVPEDHLNALMTGFRAAYDAIVRDRAELLADGGLLRRCAEDEIRIVVRPTRTYAKLLGESTHPDVLRDGLDRDQIFDVLAMDAADELQLRLVPPEIDDLWAGDVPIFLGRPGSPHVLTSTGVVLPDLLERTGLASAIAKINRMGEADRHDQEWVIRAALASRAEPDDHVSGGLLPGSVAAVVPDPERLLSSACAVADEIVARAVHGDDRVNWLTLEQVDGRHWMLLPMGAGLGAGYSGVALFLAQLGALTGITRYTDLARKAICPIPRMVEALQRSPGLAEAVGAGGFLGLGGISYALARLATLLDDPAPLRWLTDLVPLVGLADAPDQTSLATGRAGGLVAMLAVHAETGLTDAGTLAAEFARRLVDPTEQTTRPAGLPGDSLPTNGFLWGQVGIGWALRRFAASGGGSRYAELGATMLARDADSAEPAGDSPDLGWCSGLAGELLAHGDAAARAGEGYLDLLAEQPILLDMSPCHGELGVLESLAALGAGGDDRAAAITERRTAFLLGALDQFGPHCGLPGGVSCAGLLAGLAGIGYGLLRLGRPAEVPSLLMFDS